MMNGGDKQTRTPATFELENKESKRWAYTRMKFTEPSPTHGGFKIELDHFEPFLVQQGD